MSSADIVLVRKHEGDETTKDAYFSVFPPNGRCEKLERYFHNIVNPESDYYRKGVLIYNNGDLVGVSKFMDQKSLIPFFSNGDGSIPVLDLPENVSKVVRKIAENRFVNLMTFLKRDMSSDWIRIDTVGTLPLGDDGGRCYGRHDGLEANPHTSEMIETFPGLLEDVYGVNAGVRSDYRMKVDYSESLVPLENRGILFRLRHEHFISP